MHTCLNGAPANDYHRSPTSLSITSPNYVQYKPYGNFKCRMLYGWKWANWDEIVITSNLPWREWYDWNNTRGNPAALERRITRRFLVENFDFVIDEDTLRVFDWSAIRPEVDVGVAREMANADAWAESAGFNRREIPREMARRNSLPPEHPRQLFTSRSQPLHRESGIPSSEGLALSDAGMHAPIRARDTTSDENGSCGGGELHHMGEGHMRSSEGPSHIQRSDAIHLTPPRNGAGVLQETRSPLSPCNSIGKLYDTWRKIEESPLRRERLPLEAIQEPDTNRHRTPTRNGCRRHSLEPPGNNAGSDEPGYAIGRREGTGRDNDARRMTPCLDCGDTLTAYLYCSECMSKMCL